MPLKAGQRLLHYRVVEKIGQGGMGVVWKALDTTLDREVALKTLPAELASDAGRLARLQREARVLAALNHPGIAQVYGFERIEMDGGVIHCLVLELVQGETLAGRLRRGPLEVEAAREACRQIAAALEAAHEKGIVHRDLKPGNVILCPDGTTKVLDFGLARALQDPAAAASDLSLSPTVTAEATLPGTILGTASYMSPEQARGQPVDARTDVWSLGVILYECLTGRTPFPGETASDAIGAILQTEPDWSRLPAATGPALRRLLRRCLAKDRRQRLQAMGDVRLELEDAPGLAADQATSSGQAPARRPAMAALPWTLCAILGAALAAALWLGPGGPAAPAEPASVRRSVLTLPPGSHVNWRVTRDTWAKIGFSRLLAISPDGRKLAVTVQEGGRTSLYLKDADAFAPRAIAGADGARGAFFSPDGLWIAFLSENSLRKIRLPGGVPQPVCEVNSAAFDGTWLADGTMVYSTDTGLWRVDGDGGTPEQLTTIDIDAGISGHHFPGPGPDPSQIIFTLTTDSGRHAALLALEDRTWKILKRHASDARYVPSGHLVFARGAELFASTYDPDGRGDPGAETPLAAGIHTVPGLSGAVVHVFATSRTGLLGYAPAADPPEPDTLLWVDPAGKEEAIVSGPGYWMHQRLSPDGTRILFNRLMSDGMMDLYIHDLRRDHTDLLTRRGHAYDAEWSPDGQAVAFAALDNQGRSIYVVPSDFSGPARKVIAGTDARPHFSQWTREGSTFVLFDRSSRGGIWTARADGQGGLTELINTPLGEGWAMISPDGRLIAYVGFEGERQDVYVQRYPDLGPRLRVSRDGGGQPRWGPGSRALYFRHEGRIFKANMEVAPTLQVTSVVTLPLEDGYDTAASGHQHYDLSLDGSRFLMVKHGRAFHPGAIHLVDNWPAGLEAVPGP